jgi:hypothetical protein
LDVVRFQIDKTATERRHLQNFCGAEQIWDHTEKAERYWSLMRKYYDLAQHAKPPVLEDSYRKVAAQFG